MPRRPRTVIPEVAHHITQRGNNRQRVFFSDRDFRLYLDLIAGYAKRFGVRLLGYCLMENHIHLIAVPSAETALARALGGAHSEFALAVNAEAGRSGHLWQNRFFSCPMDEAHSLHALRYVERNPVRAGLAPVPWEWPWSSARAHALDDVEDPVLDPLWREYFGEWDIGAWRSWLGQDETPFANDLRRATRTGAPLGGDPFVAGLERQTGRLLRVRSQGRPTKRSRMDAGQAWLFNR